jgi:uncharacterized membrane protein YfcA
LILVAEFTTAEAIPLSNCIILGASIANYFQLFRFRHPNKSVSRPLISYELAILIQPFALVGTIVGVILNGLSPDWFVLLLLVCLLVTTIYKSGKKGLQLWAKEQQAAAAKQQTTTTNAAASAAASHPVVATEYGSGDPTRKRRTQLREDAIPYVDDDMFDEIPSDTITEEEVSGANKELKQGNGPILDSEFPDFEVVRLDDEIMGVEATNIATANSGGRQEVDLPLTAEERVALRHKLEAEDAENPWGKITLLVMVMVIITVHSLLVGSGKGPSLVGIVRCSAGYWLGLVAILPVLGAITLLVAWYLIKTHRLREKADYNFIEGDIHWTRRNTIVISCIAVLAGITSSMLGLGGGIVLGPVMLEFGVHPEVVTSTSSFMILFTSLSSVIQFIFGGRIEWAYGLVLGTVGVISSAVGQTVIHHVVHKYQKMSILVLTLVGVVIVSSVLLTTTGLMDLYYKIMSGASLGIKNFCPIQP